MTNYNSHPAQAREASADAGPSTKRAKPRSDLGPSWVPALARGLGRDDKSALRRPGPAPKIRTMNMTLPSVGSKAAGHCAGLLPEQQPDT